MLDYGTLIVALVGIGSVAGSVTNDQADPDRGTTLAYKHRDPVTAVSTIGCEGADGERCAPYEGDTPCSQARPLICFNDMEVPPPRSLPPGGENTIWLGGVIATTPEVAGNAFAAAPDAHGYCEQQFGSGWQALSIEAHRAVNFRAYGFFGDDEQRGWVDVPGGAVCWAPADPGETTPD